MDLERTFTFRNSKQTYSGIPIIVANMDTVGTFEMAAVMSQVGWRASLPLPLSLGRAVGSPFWTRSGTEKRRKRSHFGSLTVAELFGSESGGCWEVPLFLSFQSEDGWGLNLAFRETV